MDSLCHRRGDLRHCRWALRLFQRQHFAGDDFHQPLGGRPRHGAAWRHRHAGRSDRRQRDILDIARQRRAADRILARPFGLRDLVYRARLSAGYRWDDPKLVTARLEAGMNPLLQVSGLTRSFGGVRAVDDVSFDLSPGKLLALLGSNGAGKSTCFNITNGQPRPDAGEVLLDGEGLIGKKPRDIWRLGVGRTFQIAATFHSMTVIENVQMALISHAKRTFHAWRPARAHFRDEAHALLAEVGMEAHAERPSSVLAYGDVKRVELAIALANKPKLLLMDEPTAGMAPRERNELMALTKRLVTQNNVGVLFTEHSMDVVFAFADRMIVLARGKLIAEGSGDAVRDNPKVREVYFGSGRIVAKRVRACATRRSSACPG